MKFCLVSVIGVAGSLIAGVFGGWSAAMTTLCVCMALDYISGLIVAGVFKASKKTSSGGLESRAGWKGLCRKCSTFMLVIVAVLLDSLLCVNYIKDAVCISFICNEILSLTENAGLMGVPIPAVISNAIDVLQRKDEKK